MKNQEMNKLAKKVLEDIEALEDVEIKNETKDKNKIEKETVNEIEVVDNDSQNEIENAVEEQNESESVIEEQSEILEQNEDSKNDSEEEQDDQTDNEDENANQSEIETTNQENTEDSNENEEEDKNSKAIIKAYNYRRKKRIKSSLIRLAFLSMLLMLSTYTWFTTQKDVTLSNLRGAVEVVENMEISLDAKSWYQEINLSNAATLFAEAQTSRDEVLEEDETNRTTALSILPMQLLPVSGAGEMSSTILPMYVGTAKGTKIEGITQCSELDATTKKIVDNGYFAFDIYIKNTSKDNDDDILQLNLNSAAQVLTQSIQKTIIDENGNSVERTYTGNESSGLQNTIRVALALYEGEVSSTATQLRILESTSGKNIKDLAIWEPNASDHVEYIVNNNNKLINGSSDNKITFDDGDLLTTYALNADAVTEGTIENIYDISSDGLGAQNTFKTENIKNNAGEVVDYRIYTDDSKPINITSAAADSHEFKIPTNKVMRMRIYVWMEGQDVDCINLASLGGGIELNLGLTKDDEIGNALVDERVTYSTTEPTTGTVTTKITLEKEIAVLPEGWSFANADKTQITKTYSANINERLEIECADGTTEIVQIRIENII